MLATAIAEAVVDGEPPEKVNAYSPFGYPRPSFVIDIVVTEPPVIVAKNVAVTGVFNTAEK